MDAVLYDQIDGFQNRVVGSMPGIRAMGLDVGATNNGLTNSNNTITPSGVIAQTSQESGSTSLALTGTGLQTGQLFNATFTANLNKIVSFSTWLGITASTTTFLYKIYDRTTSTLLYTSPAITISGATLIEYAHTPSSPILFTPGHILEIALDVNAASNTVNVKYNTSDSLENSQRSNGNGVGTTGDLNIKLLATYGDAGYLLKPLTRLNLDRLTFPKIYKPANTKCQVDMCGANLVNDFVPFGTVFGLHFDSNMTPFVSEFSPTLDTGTYDTTNKVFGTASKAYNGSQYTQYADSTIHTLGSADWWREFRVKKNATGVQYLLLGQTDASRTAAGTSYYLISTASNTLELRCYVGSTEYALISSGTITDTSFHTIKFGRDGGFIRIWIDGTLSGSLAISGTINDVSANFCIGRAGDATLNPLNGNIDEFIMVNGQSPGLSNYTVKTTQYGFYLQAVGASTVTFPTEASATTDFYKDDIVVVTSGTGAGQTRKITAYNGTTKVATLDQAWTTNPTTVSGFALYDGIPSAQNVSPGFDFSTIDYTANPTVNVICSLERQTGATASPSMGVPIVTSIEKDWVTQAPVSFYTTSATYVTLLSASGRYRVDSIALIPGSNTAVPMIKITADGVVVLETATLMQAGATAGVPIILPFNITSATSLLVEVKNTIGTLWHISYSR